MLQPLFQNESWCTRLLCLANQSHFHFKVVHATRTRFKNEVKTIRKVAHYDAFYWTRRLFLNIPRFSSFYVSLCQLIKFPAYIATRAWTDSKQISQVKKLLALTKLPYNLRFSLVLKSQNRSVIANPYLLSSSFPPTVAGWPTWQLVCNFLKLSEKWKRTLSNLFQVFPPKIHPLKNLFYKLEVKQKPLSIV